MEHLISIIVPVYNVEKYIHKCIDSIINQTYKNLEILLIDDGSTDNSSSICDKYEKLDSRIKVIHKKNNCAAAARNTGLEVATGEYIAFVDSDDFIDKNMYKDMIEKSLKYDCDLVMCDCYKVCGDNKEKFTHNIRGGFYNKEQLYKEYFDKLLMKDDINYPPTISNCVCLIKKEIIKNNNLKYVEGIRFSEDLLFGSQIMYYVERFYYMKDKYYYNYISNPLSVTSTYYEGKWDIFLKLYEEIRLFFKEKKDYDFSKQIYYCLLFFVYNSINNIIYSPKSYLEKYRDIKKILKNNEVKEMFKKINISELDIPRNQIIKTKIYKYRVGIMIFIIYMSNKK